MKLMNSDYLKATALLMGAVLWVVILVALLTAFIGAILTANVAGVVGLLIVGAIFTYLTCMAVDKLDL